MRVLILQDSTNGILTDSMEVLEAAKLLAVLSSCHKVTKGWNDSKWRIETEDVPEARPLRDNDKCLPGEAAAEMDHLAVKLAQEKSAVTSKLWTTERRVKELEAQVAAITKEKELLEQLVEQNKDDELSVAYLTAL